MNNSPVFPPDLARQMAALKQEIRILKSRMIMSGDWTNLLPIGTLISQGSPYDDLQYYLTQDSWVVFEGVGRTNIALAAGATLFTLPSDVPAPLVRKMFNVQSTAGAIRVDIDTTRAVITMTALPTVGSYVSFEGVRYRW